MVTVNQMKEFVEKFNYQPTEQALNKILNTWAERKANLLEHFRRHPNWDEDNLAIILNPTEYELEYSREAVKNFRDWVSDNWTKALIPEAKDLKDPNRRKEYLDNILLYIREVNNTKELYNLNSDEALDFQISIDTEKINAEKEKLEGEITEFNKYERINVNGERKYVEKEKYTKTYNAVRAINYIKDYCNDYILTADEANAINSYLDIGAREGQKISKVIGKICREVGIDTIKDMKKVTTHHTDDEGNDVVSEREYDDGYNRQYQFMADGASPKKTKLITVISLNPMDYWGMSLGKNWSSCHSIDKENVRNMANNYQGQYSNGTMSYMLDSSTVIMYTLELDKEGKIYCNEDKLRRIVFSINENASVVLQSRVYPDGRDGGDQSLAKQFRGKMELIVSELWGIENKWIVKKGTSECRNNIITDEYIHYPDYEHYNDCNIILNKEIKERPKIHIGSKGICIRCGEENTSSENITCYDCRCGRLRGFLLNPEPEVNENDAEDIDEPDEEQTEEVVTEENTNENTNEDIETHICAHCGAEINPENMIIIDDREYCCEDCAHEDGYEYCVDIEDWVSEDEAYFCMDDSQFHTEDDCYCDDYNGEYYSGDPYIETDDGNFYSSEENAQNDGYEQDYFTDTWMRDLRYDDYEGVFFDIDNDDCIETSDDEYFPTEESARNAGYVQEYFSDNWMHEDDLYYDEYYDAYFDSDNGDVICTSDGEYFISSVSAKDAGYVKEYLSGEWMKKDELEYDEYEDRYFDTSNDNAIVTEDGKYFASEDSADDNGYVYNELRGWISKDDDDNYEYEVGA